MKVWMRMGMYIDIDKEIIENIKNNKNHKLIQEAVIEAIKKGNAEINGDSYICDDDHNIGNYGMEMSPIQIQACESFFYNPKE